MHKQYKLHKIITMILICTTVLILASGCDSSKESGGAPVSTDDFLVPEAPGDEVTGNQYASIDASNADDGYVLIKYLGNSDKAKLQIKKDSDIYTYDLYKTDDFLVFPLSCGSGRYTIEVYENVSGTQYAQVYAETADAELSDENSPFLYPNFYVNYDRNDDVVALSLKETDSCKTQLEVVEKTFNYVTKNIDYDYELADSASSGYIPDLDKIIKSEKGICFDYASLMSAMLRIRNIPTKLVVGYSGDLYHAWISVYISDVGWIDNVIEFDGKSWTLMDPTFAASEGTDESADYITNKDSYHALYFY